MAARTYQDKIVDKTKISLDECFGSFLAILSGIICYTVEIPDDIWSIIVAMLRVLASQLGGFYIFLSIIIITKNQ